MKVTPLYLAFVACRRIDCSCADLPEERRQLSSYLHHFWGGALPPTVREGSRFLSALELQELSAERRAALLHTIPDEFKNSGWRRCKASGCCFWDNSTAGLLRHRHLLHFSTPVKQLFDRFYLCSFQLPRPLGPSQLPEGPYNYCQMEFDSIKALDRHKDESSHKRKKKKKNANTGPAHRPSLLSRCPGDPPAPVGVAPLAPVLPEEPFEGEEPLREQQRLEREKPLEHGEDMPSRVELRYKIHGQVRWYCGTVCRPSTKGERKFLIKFDNGDRETRSLTVGSSTWRLCDHLKGACDHDWCAADFLEGEVGDEGHSSEGEDRSDSD